MLCDEAMDKTKSLEAEGEEEVAMEVLLAGEQILPKSLLPMMLYPI